MGGPGPGVYVYMRVKEIFARVKRQAAAGSASWSRVGELEDAEPDSIHSEKNVWASLGRPDPTCKRT